MTLEELKSLLRTTRYRNFNVVVNPVGPSNEWTEAEQIEDCCALVPDPDPCVGDGKKVEPWDGWTDDEKQRLGFTPSGVSAQELLSRAEAFAGAGNVHLKIRKVGSVPCGEKVTSFVGALDCCTDPDELLKGSGDRTVSPGDEVSYNVVSGSGSEHITWDTIGTGLTVVKDGEWSARGNVDDCFCTPVVVYATDSCESVAPWIVSADDGSWSIIDDESLSSPFGWFQDGTAGIFYVMGFNDDNTKVSTQHYWEAEYSGTVEQVCGTTMPGINDDPIATPQLSQGFYKCSEENIWVRLKEGYTNVWAVRYAVDNQNTIEYTEGDCIEELLYDTVNSVEEMAVSSSGYVRWEGGIGPYLVSVSGVDFYTNSGLSETQVTTNSTYVQIYAGPGACGTATVRITDSCGSSIDGEVYSTDGYWVPDVGCTTYYYNLGRTYPPRDAFYYAPMDECDQQTPGLQNGGEGAQVITFMIYKWEQHGGLPTGGAWNRGFYSLFISDIYGWNTNVQPFLDDLGVVAGTSVVGTDPSSIPVCGNCVFSCY